MLLCSSCLISPSEVGPESALVFGDDCPRAGCEGLFLRSESIDPDCRSSIEADRRFGLFIEHMANCLVCRRGDRILCGIRNALWYEHLAAIPLDGGYRSPAGPNKSMVR